MRNYFALFCSVLINAIVISAFFYVGKHQPNIVTEQEVAVSLEMFSADIVTKKIIEKKLPQKEITKKETIAVNKDIKKNTNAVIPKKNKQKKISKKKVKKVKNKPKIAKKLKKKHTKKKSIKSKTKKKIKTKKTSIKKEKHQAKGNKESINKHQKKKTTTKTRANTNYETAKSKSAKVSEKIASPKKYKQINKSAAKYFKRELFNLIKRNKKYPRQARLKNKQGTVRVSFAISSSGVISNVRVIKSSGNSLLDNSAIRAVKKVGKFKPRPAGVNSTLSINLSFKLH